MRIIGLTGGIGCGKSTVAAIMKESFGCHVVIADQVGRELMEKGRPCYFKIVESFGEKVLAKDKSLDRERLSAIVFQDQKALSHLNSIIHPCVSIYIREEIQKAKKERGVSDFVIESAILIEAGYESVCDEIWYVHASIPVRIERLIKNRGYSEEKIRAVMKNQKPESFFLLHCHQVIDNDRNQEEKYVFRQLERLLLLEEA